MLIHWEVLTYIGSRGTEYTAVRSKTKRMTASHQNLLNRIHDYEKKII